MTNVGGTEDYRLGAFYNDTKVRPPHRCMEQVGFSSWYAPWFFLQAVCASSFYIAYALSKESFHET